MLLFYTAAGDKSMLSEGKKRTQCLAYSNDGGKSFQKYRGNPVIGHVIHHNRDPKIVWVEELQKYLIALYLIEDRYQLFVSENLLDWTPLQEIRIPNETECPDIFGFMTGDKTYWVLMGASDKYVVGVFEDGKFLPITREKQLSYSPNSYAAQSFSGLDDGRVIRMAWHRLNMPLLRAPHQMSLPVEMKLNIEASDLFLTAYPVEEIKRLYVDEKSISDKTLDQPFEMNLDQAAYDIHMVTDYDGNITLDLFGHSLSIDTGKNLLTFGKLTMPISSDQKTVDLRIIVDRCSFEVFAGGGRYCATFYAVCDYNLPYLRLSADYPVKISKLSCHKLASVHEEAEK
jgi:sucrose-6-phosphate hydrolase SacC (GH32 family)